MVVVLVPFSDLSDSKKGPAIVLSNLKGNDIILCQITSQHFSDDYRIELLDNDFDIVSLNNNSYIGPNRIFTAGKQIISKSVGIISTKKRNEVYTALNNFFKEYK